MDVVILDTDRPLVWINDVSYATFTRCRIFLILYTLKHFLIALLISLVLLCSHCKPWIKKKGERWQFFKHLLKGWAHVWACHETTAEFLPYSHFDEPSESLGRSQVKSGASCTFWCFVSDRAAFVQLSERERFAVCQSVFGNHKHTAFVNFHLILRLCRHHYTCVSYCFHGHQVRNYGILSVYSFPVRSPVHFSSVQLLRH